MNYSFYRMVMASAACLAMATSATAATTVWSAGRLPNVDGKFWVQALHLQTNGNRVYAIFQEGLGAAECAGKEGPSLNIKLLTNGNQFFIVQNVDTLSLPDAGTVVQRKIDVSDKVSPDDVNVATSVEAFMPGHGNC